MDCDRAERDCTSDAGIGSCLGLQVVRLPMVEGEQRKVTLGGVRLSFGGDKGHNDQQVVSGVKGARDANFPDDAARSHRHPCDNDACGSCGSSAAGLCRDHRGRRLDGDFAVCANGVLLMEGKRRRLSNGCGKSAARIALALFAAAMASVLVGCADAAGCMRRMERTRTGRSMVRQGRAYIVCACIHGKRWLAFPPPPAKPRVLGLPA